MLKAIIHIGHGKTGTSAIQAWLANNKTALAARNFRYLESNRVYNAHHHLAPRNHSPLNPAIAASARAEIEKTQEDIIVSSEQIYYSTPQNVNTLVQMFDGLEVEVVLYVRLQEYLLVSTLMQWLRENHKPFRSPYDFFSKFGFLWRFSSRMDHLFSHTGAAPPLSVRVYSDGVKMDTVRDFCSLVGLAVDEEHSESSVNESISPVFCEAMYHINRNVADSEERKELLARLQDMSGKVPWSLEDLFSQDQIEEIRAFYREDNCKLLSLIADCDQRSYWEATGVTPWGSSV